MVSGGGVITSGADKELYEFAEKLNCPVASTMMGLGSYPTTAEKFTGMIGMHGTKASNLGINNADVVVAIGMRFSDRVTSTPRVSSIMRKSSISTWMRRKSART